MLTLLFCSTIAACALPPVASDGCEVRGRAPRSDIALARAACANARRRFASVIGRPPDGTIILSDEQGLVTWTEGGTWTLTWPTTAKLAAGSAGLPSAPVDFVSRQWEDVLPHEIGHIMLAAWLYVPGRPLAGDYGTYLPDWVDEAVAIAMEPAATRAFRLSQTAAFPSPRLGELLSAPHPGPMTSGDAFSTSAVISRPCSGPCDRPRPDDTRVITSRVFRDGRTTVDTTYVAGDHRLETDAVARFYTLAYALWAYVERRGGRESTETLLRRLRTAPSDSAALVGLPGLPGTLSEIERDWRAWVVDARRR
jgi:hypothetical protein